MATAAELDARYQARVAQAALARKARGQEIDPHHTERAVEFCQRLADAARANGHGVVDLPEALKWPTKSTIPRRLREGRLTIPELIAILDIVPVSVDAIIAAVNDPNDTPAVKHSVRDLDTTAAVDKPRRGRPRKPEGAPRKASSTKPKTTASASAGREYLSDDDMDDPFVRQFSHLFPATEDHDL